ncbi:uncharacterized protein LOC118749290, partial [Rhagoletis pomonella]|uniref:uncharacterized protein LOC118749290 n=1 Tax=Rhagoletis pomonella TaxID=28610 RepID=UPI001781DDD4
MYFCFVCNKMFDTTAFIIFHLKHIHFLSESKGIVLNCIKSKNCNKTFCTFRGLKRHAENCSAGTNANAVFNVTSELISAVDMLVDETSKDPDFGSSNVTYCSNNFNFEDSIQASFSKFAKQLMASGIAETNVNKIFSSVEEIVANLFQKFEAFLKNRHSEVNCTILKETFHCFDSCVLSHIKNFSSNYKRSEMYKKDELYVEPVSKPLGGRWDIKTNRSSDKSYKHYVECTFQYVPIVDTISTLFKNKSFKNLYYNKNHLCKDGVYVNYCCSKNYKQSTLFQSNENALQIQLFYDEFEVVNPLGSKTGIHKIGAIYFSIRNLPYEYFSKLRNIYLVALFFCTDLKNEYTDFNMILAPIVADLKYLEEDGINIDGCNIKGTLVTVAHDNLGANILSGFASSFRATYYCRICTMNRDKAQKSVVENSNLLRLQSEYNDLFNLNKDVIFIDLKESKGIKHFCKLNELRYFHIMDSNNVDLMHDVLEGAVPFVLKNFFKTAIQMKYINLAEINSKIRFYNYGFLQKKNLCSQITVDRTGASLGLTASQNLCLISHFPFIFFDLQEKLPHLWEGITSLLQIIRITLSPVIEEKDIEILSETIKSHLTCIVEQYNLNLLPKHHMLTHYPSIIRKLGPVVHSWTMRYEAKHRDFIKQASVTNNYINVCKTLASRYQKNFSYFLEHMTTEKTASFGKLKIKATSILEPEVKKYFMENEQLNIKIYTANSVKINYGFSYRPNFYVFLGKETTDVNKFGLIKSIYVNNGEIYFHLMIYFCKYFNPILSAYEIFCNGSSCIIKFNELKFNRPYEAYENNNKIYLMIPVLLP